MEETPLTSKLTQNRIETKEPGENYISLKLKQYTTNSQPLTPSILSKKELKESNITCFPPSYVKLTSLGTGFERPNAIGDPKVVRQPVVVPHPRNSEAIGVDPYASGDKTKYDQVRRIKEEEETICFGKVVWNS